jgi:hypothetical protein
MAGPGWPWYGRQLAALAWAAVFAWAAYVIATR